MRAKPVAVILALTLGILGIHRLYLGQYLRAILYLIYPVVLITLFLYFSGTLHIVREQLHLERSFEALYFLLPFLLIPIFDAIWLAMMNHAKFFDRYNTTIGTPWGRIWRSVVSLAAGAGIALGLYQMFFIVKPVDVSKEADFKLSAQELVEAFAGNTGGKYEGRLLEVHGVVVEDEFRSERGRELRHLILFGEGQTNVKCLFQAAAQPGVLQVSIGDSICVKGILDKVANDIDLKECQICP